MVKKRKHFKSRQSSLRGRHRPHYPVKYKLKAVKMHLEEGVAQWIIAKQLGVCQSALVRWVSQYRSGGVAALAQKPRKDSVPKIPSAVRDQIVALKQAEPTHGKIARLNWASRGGGWQNYASLKEGHTSKAIAESPQT